MKESDLEIVEILALKTLVLPEMNSKTSSKKARFFKAIFRKLELQEKLLIQEYDNEISQLNANQQSEKE